MVRSNIFKKLAIDSSIGATGAGVGFMIGGLPGALFGGAITPVATEMITRALSKKEKERIEIVIELSKKKIAEKISQGAHTTNNYSQESMKSLFEGVLLKARDSYEEKKLPLLANLVAAAPFTNTPNENLIQTLQTAEQLTYRQLCIISLVGTSEYGHDNLYSDMCLREEQDLKVKFDEQSSGIYHDIYSLIQSGILTQMTEDGKHIEGVIVPGDIRPNRVKMHYPGMLLYNGLALDTISSDDLEAVRKVLIQQAKNKFK